MRIKSLHVRNFRSLVSVQLPLHDLNVVIGPNGSGKTALTEVLQLLQRGSQGELGRFFDDHGGYRSVISQNNGQVSAESLAVQVDLAKSDIRDDQIDTAGFGSLNQNIHNIQTGSTCRALIKCFGDAFTFAGDYES